MAGPRFTEEELNQHRALAAEWGRIVSKRAFGDEGPGLDVDFRTFEQIAAAAARGLTEGTLQLLLQQQAHKLPAEQCCPHCGRVCPTEPLLQLLEERGRWEGSSSELLKVLEEQLRDKVRRMTGWPKNARSLSGHLKRVAPNLRAAGWTMDQDRSSKKRSWVIQRAGEPGPAEPSRDPSFWEHGESMPDEAEWRDESGHDANDADGARAWRRDHSAW